MARKHEACGLWWPGLAATGVIAAPCSGLARPGLCTLTGILSPASLRWPAAAASVQPETSATEAGCSYRSLVSTHCHVEPGPDGSPVRRCETLRRTFRQCPGRPTEELESTTEETTVEPLHASPSLGDIGGESWMMRPGERYGGAPGVPFPDSSAGAIPGELPAAKLFDEFFALAQQLQAGLEHDIGSNPDLQAALPPGMLPPGMQPPHTGEPQRAPSLFQWLFGSKNDSSTGPSTRQPSSSTPYNGYERDFQDV